MSDGPHRTLSMRPWWKQAALRADKSAFDITECAEAIEIALEREFREELRPTFLSGLRNAHEEPSLFSPADSIHLHKVNAETPLEQRVLDNISVLTPAERADVNGLRNAFANAIRNEVPRFNKQIEEHFLRESGTGHARRERGRLDEAAARADVDALARRLLDTNGLRSVPILTKKTGLDDGVKL